MEEKTKAEIIKDPNPLQDKIPAGATGEKDFSAADRTIEALTVVFVQRLPKDLAAIDAALAALELKPGDKTRITNLFRLVHDLKGQAGTFDYNLISVIGNDLCRFIQRPIAMTPRCLKVMHFYVEAMKQVAEKKMTGDGYELGMRMIDTLHSMTHKVLMEED